MKLRELLIESAGQMKRGMLVQSLDQFVKDPNANEDVSNNLEEDEFLDEDGEWKPIQFSPKFGAKYSPTITPSDTPDAEREAYSSVISPQELAQVVHNKNSFVIYYEEKSGDKRVKRRITTEPIYMDIPTIEKTTKKIESQVKKENPKADAKTIKTKTYAKLNQELDNMAVKFAISKSPEVKNAIKSGAVTAAQLKADTFTTTASKVGKPAVHRSSVPIIGENGEIIYDLDGLASRIRTRPVRLLKFNEKMAKSAAGQDISIANIGIPALKGLVIDEKTNEFRVVDTCPGAGKCKQYCYATRGGYIQYSASSENMARILNFWYNDPKGFVDQLVSELKSMIKPGVKVYFRWHDSGDFFIDAYLDSAKEVAEAVPEVTIYAYTKMANVAKDTSLPDNFIVNFSAGALPTETKQIDFRTTKFSEVVPPELFKDEKTTGIGLKRLQERDPEAQENMKRVLADYYKIDKKSILTYDEMLATKESKQKNKYNVMIVPSLDGDLAAARRDVLGSYLLYH